MASKTNIPKKQLNKRPPPVIKQTKTSLYRMIKANPLLLLDRDNKEIRADIDDLGLPVSVTNYYPANYFLSQSTISRTTENANNSKLNKTTQAHIRTTALKKYTNPKCNISSKTKPKSISSLQTALLCKSPPKTNLQKPQVYNLKTCVQEEPEEEKVENKVSDIPSSIEIEKQNVFKTPTAYNRRSIAFFTPTTVRKSLYNSACGVTDLQIRLNDWLQKHGKSMGSFHHLKCFSGQNLTGDSVEENKENLEPDIPEDSNNQKISASSKETNLDLNIIAHEALQDVHKLILDNYPKDQCEAWLGMIRQKYHNLENEPTYWECRAAIEQSRGNITTAVDCYKTAIVKGANIGNVDDSLDQLLKKFSLLNINTAVESGNFEKEQQRIDMEARTAFKTSIIQFAIQERSVKKNEISSCEKKFFATPVRRSTRLSRSAYTSTPSVQICSSLQELEPDVREAINFRKNDSLCRFFE